MQRHKIDRPEHLQLESNGVFCFLINNLLDYKQLLSCNDMFFPFSLLLHQEIQLKTSLLTVFSERTSAFIKNLKNYLSI